ncbi:GntR family transcriptional regulator [Falsiroseomonas sp. HC035]|uniref:GntR family transcriptional regulator n=1 Tax=Falsiroseomonas sp. HC035 TaxID=3390999 RepID=UPI003D310FF3
MNQEAQEIEAALRARILSGDLPPGMRLREMDLAESFRVSRSPVREALTALTRDGLTEHGPHRGFSVRVVSADEVEEAYEMRALLEGQAARLAAERGLPREAEHAMLAAVLTVDDLLRIEGPVDGTAWQAQNTAFHAQLRSTVPNRFFLRALEAVHRVPLVGHVAPRLYDRALLSRFNAQHRGILNAIASRQGGRAEHLMREHVEEARVEIKMRDVGRAA